MKKSMLSHLRAALEIAAAQERERIHDVLDDFDAKHARRRELLAPIIRALDELAGDLSPEFGVEISPAPQGHRVSIRFHDNVTSDHLVVTTADDNSQYVVSHTHSMQGDMTESRSEYKTPEAALEAVVGEVGRHIGARQAHVERRGTTRGQV